MGEREVGVAVDFSPCSKKALRWAAEHVIRGGDRLVLINVQPEGYYEEGEMQLWEATGSRRIISDLLWIEAEFFRDSHRILDLLNSGYGSYNGAPSSDSSTQAFISLSDFSSPTISKKYGVKPDPESLDLLNCIAQQKKIDVVLKIFYGDAREKICEAIDKVPLSYIVIGSRGLSKIKREGHVEVEHHLPRGVLLGSVSDYVVNNCSCPVTVVKNLEG